MKMPLIAHSADIPGIRRRDWLLRAGSNNCQMHSPKQAPLKRRRNSYFRNLIPPSPGYCGYKLRNMALGVATPKRIGHLSLAPWCRPTSTVSLFVDDQFTRQYEYSAMRFFSKPSVEIRLQGVWAHAGRAASTCMDRHYHDAQPKVK
jgi:hypothetical protein